MHELSIAISILEVAAQEAQKHGDVRVRAVHLKLGQLSGVAKEALVSAFGIARESWPWSDAELLVEETPVRIRCFHCRADQPIVSMQEFVCSACGTASANIVQGRELDVVALEIE
jgi:hydrogenase nickel incorporation protein HypA/HybF